jgi:predicted exporter
VLKDAVDGALDGWRSGVEKQASSGEACRPSMPLWDSMAKALADLSQQPGRHVLLVVSDGQDRDSKILWAQMMHRAQTDSAAVFALTNIPQQMISRARR